jgi:ubiquinone biosynthesis protein
MYKNPSDLDSFLREMSPKELRAALATFVPPDATQTERIAAIELVLNSANGLSVRAAMGRWISEHVVPAGKLVPAAHVRWIPVVRDAMLYVVSHLSSNRLAPKLLEQLELPLRTHPETRLLRLISKVPGLQKLGQVLAHNRHLNPSLRQALIGLENGIRDVKAAEIAELIRQRLGSRIVDFDVRFRPVIMSEASVSAIVRFTWSNPDTGRRERGVFKVLKPYIPLYFGEDMEMLQGLAEYFGSKLNDYGLSGNVLADTFTKVRRLLEHEVDLPGEQKTLRSAYAMYQRMPGVRVPKVITPLCTSDITAMSEEQGTKITLAVRRMSAWQRARLSERLVEALVALPLFSAENDSLFHADPHAGNLFYDSATGQIVIFDWALTERLTREQRRHLALLFGFVGLRDRVSVALEIEALRQNGRAQISRPSREVRDQVCDFIDELPLARLPSAVDAVRLLERLAMNGMKFPAPLIMLSKVMLTLDGILTDLGASENCMGIGIARHLVRQSMTHPTFIASPIRTPDWIALECSAIMYFGRLWIRWEELLLAAITSRTKPSPQPSLA